MLVLVRGGAAGRTYKVPHFAPQFQESGSVMVRVRICAAQFWNTHNVRALLPQITVVTISRMPRWSSVSSVIGLLIATSHAR